MKLFTCTLSVFSLLCGFALPVAAQRPSASPSAAGGSSLTQMLTLMASALGSPLPNDIVLSGSMEIEAGGRTETATLTAAVHGKSESYETISGEYTQSKLVYAQGQAAANGAAGSLELACTAQSALIPASLVNALASDPNTGGEIVGTETIDGVSLIHLRTWTNFSSAPDLSSFCRRDWWINPASGLLHRLVFERRAAGGATPAVEYQYDFESFQNVNGVLVPSSVRQCVNGTFYAAIQINSVQTNTGLTDQDFPIQ